MARILAISSIEYRIAMRNRWALMAILIMMLFSLALTFAGAGPTGALGVDLLTVSVASMTTLAVYLTPLLALLIAFDAISGEVERGSLALLLTYPVRRSEILLGKFVAHLAVLSVAMLIGFGAAGMAAFAFGGAGYESLIALGRLVIGSILLGATFLAIGYAVSALSRSVAGAAGTAIGVWLVLVVLYDLGLLGAVVFDDGGTFTRDIFPWLLAFNPADAFRLWSISASADVALATGMTGAGAALPSWVAPLSLVSWPVAALVAAQQIFRRIDP
ncbi:ABC transporter permease [Minwuia sp.]|uniref:ABC transporter permease n=1 Tax=Minwuia sp. TaxID=2493630 RepID=UPI003A926311